MSIIGSALTIPDSTIILNPSISKTSGPSSVSAVSASQYGNVVYVKITFNSGNTAVSAGNNTFEGTISGIPFPAGSTANGIGYAGSTVFVGGIGTTGNLSVRVLAATKTASSTNLFGVSWTYVVEN